MDLAMSEIKEWNEISVPEPVRILENETAPWGKAQVDLISYSDDLNNLFCELTECSKCESSKPSGTAKKQARFGVMGAVTSRYFQWLAVHGVVAL